MTFDVYEHRLPFRTGATEVYPGVRRGGDWTPNIVHVTTISAETTKQALDIAKSRGIRHPLVTNEALIARSRADYLEALEVLRNG